MGFSRWKVSRWDVPFCVVIFYSVVNNPIQQVFVGVDNYVRVWENSAFQQAANCSREGFNARAC